VRRSPRTIADAFRATNPKLLRVVNDRAGSPGGRHEVQVELLLLSKSESLI
jgi:hypothetical protein